MATILYLEFLELCYSVHMTHVSMQFCFISPNFTLIGQCGTEIQLTTIFTMVYVCHTGFVVTSSYWI